MPERRHGRQHNDMLVNALCVLVGEGDREPLLPCLDLLLLMVCTWSSTRCCPERSLLSEGSASDVSSAPMVVIADFSGSGAIIFPARCPSQTNRWNQRPKATTTITQSAGTEEKCGSTLRNRRAKYAERLNVPRAAALDSTLGTAPRRGGTEESSSAGAEWREVLRKIRRQDEKRDSL